MFSFKAYFWNNDVYINGQYKYAANEILTAYLNSDYYEYIEEEDIIYNLERLKKKMIISFTFMQPLPLAVMASVAKS